MAKCQWCGAEAPLRKMRYTTASMNAHKRIERSLCPTCTAQLVANGYADAKEVK